MEHVNGVDVSAYQGPVDWESVKAAGYSFAVAKVTQGASYTDIFGQRNLAGIRAAGMIAGAYHYFSWSDDPVAQAKHFSFWYTSHKGDLPPALDVEACTVAPDVAIAKIGAFLGAIEPQIKAKMLLYMSYSFAGDHLAGGSDFSGHPLWVAAYEEAQSAPVPPAWKAATMWQFSDSGSVAGISGNVDLDWFCGSLDDLRAFCLK